MKGPITTAPEDAAWAENIFSALAQRLRRYDDGSVNLEQGEIAIGFVTFAKDLPMKTTLEIMVEIARWRPDEIDLVEESKIRLWWDDLEDLARTLESLI